MKIVFKNGKEVEITQEIADILNERILAGTAKDWQTFIHDGKVFLMIKLSEVAYIN